MLDEIQWNTQSKPGQTSSSTGNLPVTPLWVLLLDARKNLKWVQTMCRLSQCPESVLILLMSLLANLVLGVIEIGNFFAGQSFEKCNARPDKFWRWFIMLQILGIGLFAMFTIDRGRLSELLPGHDFNSRVKHLPGKSFVAFEISGLMAFTILVIAAHSTCSIKGVWVALYYWLLAVVGFVLACILSFLWFVAGHHIFRQYNHSFGHSSVLKPYILSIKNAEAEQTQLNNAENYISNQRDQYRQYRAAVDGLYAAGAFSELDFPFIEKYSTHSVDSWDLIRDLQLSNKLCIQCDENFKIGDKFMVFRDCLHVCHFSCLVHRLRFSDLCYCGYGIRYAVTDPCLPGRTKEPIHELIDLHLSGPSSEAVLCWRQPDLEVQELTNSDYLEYANFWDCYQIPHS